MDTAAAKAPPKAPPRPIPEVQGAYAPTALQAQKKREAEAKRREKMAEEVRGPPGCPKAPHHLRPGSAKGKACC